MTRGENSQGSLFIYYFQYYIRIENMLQSRSRFHSVGDVAIEPTRRDTKCDTAKSHYLTRFKQYSWKDDAATALRKMKRASIRIARALVAIVWANATHTTQIRVFTRF